MKSFEISVEVVKGRVEAEVWKGDMGSLVGLDLEKSVFRLRGHFQRGMERRGKWYRVYRLLLHSNEQGSISCTRFALWRHGGSLWGSQKAGGFLGVESF